MSTIAADTIAYNASRIAEWQQMDAYDYNREAVESQSDLLQWLIGMLMQLIDDMIQGVVRLDITTYVFIAIVVILLGVFCWLIYKYRPAIFGRRKKDDLAYELEEDNIYGIDFDVELKKALDRSDYREAVRLKYLQTLKLLTDAECIDWQLHKTATQYSLEFPDVTFRQMTNHFLRIRYGYFQATPDIYEEMAAAYASLSALHPASKKGGES